MILLVSLLVLAVAAVTAPTLSRLLGREAGYVLAAVFLGVLALVLTRAGDAFDGTVVNEVPWLPTLDVSLRLRLDGLSLLFAGLVLGVGALIMAYSARYLSPARDHGRLYLLLTLFAASMLGLVLSSDVILLYVFWELTTLCSFFLIGGDGLKGARPATRAFVITATGGLALLAAMVLTVSVVGSTDLSTIIAQRGLIQQSTLAPWIGGLLIVAAFTKSAQVPVHFWLPDAMVAITPVSAYLHAATLVKGGIYLLLRFSPVFAGAPGWTVALVAVGLTSAVYGAVLALKQHDLKALLAYSTVSQLGWIIALIGVGTTTGLAVAALHTFAHALFKATLFMLVGIIDREAGSRDIRELGGLYRVMPVTATLTGLAALSMAGLPPFLGFVSKEEAYKAFVDLPGPAGAGWVVAGIAVLAASMTFAYGFRLLHGAFAGPLQQRTLYEPSWLFLAPAAVPALAGLLLGITTSALNPLVNATVQDTLRRQGDADLALWHGFTAALWLSVATVSIGLALFLARRRVDRFLDRIPAILSGAQVYDRLYASTLRVGAAVGRPARSDVPGAHLVHPVWLLVAVAAAGVVLVAGLPSGREGVTRPGDWIVVALVAVSVAAAVTVRSRLAAVVLVGVVGFVVASWFLLVGAPDVALTQTLVEVLTVLVAVLVLRRMPARFPRVPRLRAAGAAVVAVAAGAAAGIAAFALTGRREVSPAGEFLLAEGPELSGGVNVVNTVLVDFRALDTLGEITVLAAAAGGLALLLREDRRHQPVRAPDRRAVDQATVLRVTARALMPVVVVVSLVMLWRGHNEPGGGFIAALGAGAGVALANLAAPAGSRLRWGAVPFLAWGLVVSVAAGLIGLLDGSFLRPLKDTLVIGPLTQSLTTSFIFDIGVYLTVLGLVVAAVDRLADGRTSHQAAEEPPRPRDEPEKVVAEVVS